MKYGSRRVDRYGADATTVEDDVMVAVGVIISMVIIILINVLR